MRDPMFIVDQWYNVEFDYRFEKAMFEISRRYDGWTYVYNLMGS